jgi:hypothetical protein
VKQLDAQLFFELADLMAEGGWLRCSRSAARPKCRVSASVTT